METGAHDPANDITPSDRTTPGDCTPFAESPPELPPGYEFVRELGRGGMGVVHLAVESALKRPVAVKMLRRDAADRPEEVARFRTEAEAVARLRHPGIVGVYAVGEFGLQPFLTLEYCPGGSLAERLGRKPVPPREAAEVVRDLAAAVQAAHDAGVVHRDLKPSNVLVGDGGGVKVTDFGLARLTDAPGQTSTGVVMGTPAYMSPEQAAARGVGPASDVYSLGVILYECLTGRPPFQATSGRDALEMVKNAEPVPPRVLNPSVPRDLQTIALACLRKHPSRRPASARALGDDLGRWLAGEPIRARPVGPAERAMKFVRRNAVASALAAGVVVSLAVGTAASLYQLGRVVSERDAKEAALVAAREARNRTFLALRLLTDEFVENRLAAGELSKEQAAAFVRGILAQFEAFAAVTDDDVEGRFIRAEGLARVGLLRYRLGELAEAEKASSAAVDLLERLAAEFPERAEFRRDLAAARRELGVFFMQSNRAAEAGTALAEARRLQRELSEEHPDKPEYAFEEGRTLRNMGHLARLHDRLDQALGHYADAMRLHDALVAASPDRGEYRYEQALTRINLGLALRAVGKPDDADKMFRAAIATLEPLAAGPRASPTVRGELAQAYNNLGLVSRNLNRPREAEKAHAAALEIQKSLAKDYPRRLDFRRDYASSLCNTGVALKRRGKVADAEAMYRAAITEQSALVGENAANADLASDLARSRLNFAMLLRDAKRFADAEGEYAAGIAEMRKLADGPGSRPAFRADLGRAVASLANMYRDNARPDRAEAAYLEALAVQRRQAEETPAAPEARNAVAATLVNLAVLKTDGGNYAAAKAHLAEARPHHDAARKANPKHPSYLNNLANHLGTLVVARAGLADRAGAMKAAAELRDLDGTADSAYDAAEAVARCVAVAAKLAGSDAAKAYGDEALRLLGDAVGKGYRDAKRVETKPAFAELRTRQEYRALVARMSGEKK